MGKPKIHTDGLVDGAGYLTRSEVHVLKIIRRFFIENGRFPTYNELSRESGRVKSHVYTNVKMLEAAGMVRKNSTGEIVGVDFGSQRLEAAHTIAKKMAELLAQGESARERKSHLDGRAIVGEENRLFKDVAGIMFAHTFDNRGAWSMRKLTDEEVKKYEGMIADMVGVKEFSERYLTMIVDTLSAKLQ